MRRASCTTAIRCGILKLTPSERSSSAPAHLPDLPRTVTLRDGRRCLLRKIRPDDAAALQSFVAGLSERSAHQRFLASVHRLTEAQLRRFTQLEDQRECAIIAVSHPDTQSGLTLGRGPGCDGVVNASSATPGREEVIVGSARYLIEVAASQTGPVQAEFAVTVADDWQGCGLGSLLMRDLLSAARSRGITCIEGHVLAENTQMLHLARKLGFSVQPEPDEATLRKVILSLRQTDDSQ